jgi:hypothetical protein
MPWKGEERVGRRPQRLLNRRVGVVVLRRRDRRLALAELVDAAEERADPDHRARHERESGDAAGRIAVETDLR